MNHFNHFFFMLGYFILPLQNNLSQIITSLKKIAFSFQLDKHEYINAETGK